MAARKKKNYLKNSRNKIIAGLEQAIEHSKASSWKVSENQVGPAKPFAEGGPSSIEKLNAAITRLSVEIDNATDSINSLVGKF